MSTQPAPVEPLPATRNDAAIDSRLEPYVDADRAASFLALDRKTVQKLARAKKIPAHALLGTTVKGRTTWRFKLSELDEWVRSQRNSSHARCATSSTEE